MLSIYRFAFLFLGWGLAACIVVQTLFAGLAIFTDSGYWPRHTSFIHIFEWLPLLSLILVFVAKFPKRFFWEMLMFFVLLHMQYFTAHWSVAGALHPVVALLLFWLSLQIAVSATQFVANHANAD